MKNPWLQLPDDNPRVLQTDLSAVEAFNARYADKPQFKIQSQLFPEPFIGNPNGPLCVLGLNPGYSPRDDDWHANPKFANAITDNLEHKPAAYPFFFFDPELSEAPGSKWWTQRSKWLINDIGQQSLAQIMFCVELFPYHSRNYKRIPKSIAPETLVPSYEYSVHLVRKAIESKKTIIAMRAFPRWCKLVPELKTYGNVHRLNSPQNVALSPNNLEHYRELVRTLKEATGRSA